MTLYKENIDVCYITKWVGDYHAPRLVSLNSKLIESSKKMLVLQLCSKSNFYTHKQKRREKLIKCLNFESYDLKNSIIIFLMTLYLLFVKRPNIIMVLGYNDSISIAALIYAKFFFKKIIFMSDSKGDDQKRSRKKEFIKKIIIRRFDCALVAGERHKNYFRSLGFSKPIETHYDVIDNDYFYSASRRYRKFAQKHLQKLLGEKYILCVSRLVSRKRVPLAIKIFYSSKVYLLGYKFVLVGTGPDEHQIYNLINELKLEKFFLHIKEVPNHRMPAIYGGATSLILSSEYDQWGLCVNEAMSCGVPVCVSYRSGAANEIVKESNGFVFKENEHDLASQWLLKVAESDAFRTTLSNNCLETISQWNVDSFADSVLRLIKD